MDLRDTEGLGHPRWHEFMRKWRVCAGIWELTPEVAWRRRFRRYSNADVFRDNAEETVAYKFIDAFLIAWDAQYGE